MIPAFAWWIWALLALALAILETLLPIQMFLGFAVGAGSMAVVLLLDGSAAAWLSSSMALQLVAFGAVSLASWWALRRLLGIRRGQVKKFDRDINEG